MLEIMNTCNGAHTYIVHMLERRENKQNERAGEPLWISWVHKGYCNRHIRRIN